MIKEKFESAIPLMQSFCEEKKKIEDFSNDELLKLWEFAYNLESDLMNEIRERYRKLKAVDKK